MIAHLKERLQTKPIEVFIYLVIYVPLGFGMDAIGRYLNIAWFGERWQVLPCYGVYMVLCSLYVRRENFFQQYLFGLLCFAIYEMAGYATGSSIIAENNLIDKGLGRANFSLTMVVFFAVYIPTLNRLVQAIYRRLISSGES